MTALLSGQAVKSIICRESGARDNNKKAKRCQWIINHDLFKLRFFSIEIRELNRKISFKYHRHSIKSQYQSFSDINMDNKKWERREIIMEVPPSTSLIENFYFQTFLLMIICLNLIEGYVSSYL